VPESCDASSVPNGIKFKHRKDLIGGNKEILRKMIIVDSL
jgi:hypothetical protein